MTKQQLEILSLFEDCTREINTLEIYKTIEPKYFDVLDKLIKEGYLEYKKNNYLKMTGFGLSKFENPKKYHIFIIANLSLFSRPYTCMDLIYYWWRK